MFHVDPGRIFTLCYLRITCTLHLRGGEAAASRGSRRPAGAGWPVLPRLLRGPTAHGPRVIHSGPRALSTYPQPRATPRGPRVWVCTWYSCCLNFYPQATGRRRRALFVCRDTNTCATKPRPACNCFGSGQTFGCRLLPKGTAMRKARPKAHGSRPDCTLARVPAPAVHEKGASTASRPDHGRMTTGHEPRKTDKKNRPRGPVGLDATNAGPRPAGFTPSQS